MLPFPEPWRALVHDLTREPSFQELVVRLEHERRHYKVFPEPEEVFRALALTPPSEVKVVLLGSDPWPGTGQADGLAFSVKGAGRWPAPLDYMLQELVSDTAAPRPTCGDLSSWARQGVLLLNSTLTVRAHRSGSHRGLGWEPFTDGLLARLGSSSQPLVFALWGKQAQTRATLVSSPPHVIAGGAYPSSLSAARFLGSKPFSRINAALRELGHSEIDWRLG
jgi:uracil-DNA glycosylase